MKITYRVPTEDHNTVELLIPEEATAKDIDRVIETLQLWKNSLTLKELSKP